MKDKILIILVVTLTIAVIGLGLFTYKNYTGIEQGEESKVGFEREEGEKEIVLTEEDMLAIGRTLYTEGIKIKDNLEGNMPERWAGNDFEYSEEADGHKAYISVQEFRDIHLDAFSEEFKNKTLSGEVHSDALTKYKVYDGDLYLILTSHMRKKSYIMDAEELELVSFTSDKMLFNVKSKYIKDELIDKYLDDLMKKGNFSKGEIPESELETKTYKFELVKEDGRFKISSIELPY